MKIPILDYLFYKIYEFTLGTPSHYKAGLVSLITVCILLFLNLNFLYRSVFKKILYVNVFNSYELNVVTPYLASLIIGYFLFIFNNRYIRIYELYKSENEKDKKKGARYVIIYVSLTLITFLFF